ncbi:MAG: hypothetical protein IJ518_03830 [Clostridia bacterium]|nr:hypothetical protein [Clostridia bacterium]
MQNATNSHSLGRLGESYIDLQTQTLTIESEDFAWGGNRMPVTIRHLYDSALSHYRYTGNSNIGLHTADFSAMHIGSGWKLNVMQSMVLRSFRHNDADYLGYIYKDEQGEDVYFIESDKTAKDENGAEYALYTNVEDSETVYDPHLRTMTLGDDTYLFDTAGRLVRIADAYGNQQTITYTDGLLTAVTDGAERTFNFEYTNGFLTKITAPDNTCITYAYSGENLNKITYPDGTVAKIYYVGRKPNNVFIERADGWPVLYNTYTFDGDCLVSVTEHGERPQAGYTDGMAPVTTYAYAADAKRATVTLTEPADGDEPATVTTTVYTFDADGNVVGEYMYVNGENIGLTGGDPANATQGIGARAYSDNRLMGHSFRSLDNWSFLKQVEDFSCQLVSKGLKTSQNGVRMCNASDLTDTGLYQYSTALPAGDYTFSVYVQNDGPVLTGNDTGIYLSVTNLRDTSSVITSETVNGCVNEAVRLAVPFHLNEMAAVRVAICMNGAGAVLVDSAQLESNPYAGSYNLLANGGFDNYGYDRFLWGGWNPSNSDVIISEEATFNSLGALKLPGGVYAERYAWQEVDALTAAGVRETFTLSGWAKGESLPPSSDSDSTEYPFRLRAVIKLTDIEQPEEYTADFAPATEGWQFASVQFAKSRYASVEYVRVYCDYSYNNETAYFDDIQLVRDSLETGLTAEDFAGVNDVTEDSDPYMETAEDTPTFDELLDAHGNPLTETTFTDGEFGTVYRSFAYNANRFSEESGMDDSGNDLIRETDARGNTTEYTVDPVTSRTTAVTDRCDNKTAYEYDTSGRTTKVESFAALRDENGNVLRDENDNVLYPETPMANVSYGYNAMGNLTAITRGDGMGYGLTYDAHHNLATIGVTGAQNPLVTYGYKPGSGRLKSVTYANGHVMKATYNGLGQLVAEKWYESEAQAADSTATPIAYYKYVYDNDGNLVRSIDITGLKEYTYMYENGVLRSTTECTVELGDYENVTKRTFVNAIRYRYDKEGNLTRQDVSATGQTVCYEYPEGGQPVSHRYIGLNTCITSHSKTDSFGRKVFEELQLGTGFVSRQFDYVVGTATDEHKDNNKLKSTPTTNLVSRITFADGRTIEYEYDEEERITRVIDSLDGEWVYTYDALGQLLTEEHRAVDAEEYTVVNAMTYDNYGNILSKNGVTYTYDSVWKDLLTSYNGQAITYDAQGNPTSYLGHALTWEKGRQLKSFGNNTYTYNANGIRTSKTVDGIRHDYILDGTKIVCESWQNSDEDVRTLIPLYDNEDNICGVKYLSICYYFLKNLQGDVIAITDPNGEVVAQYTYDAWGKVLSVTNKDGNPITAPNNIANVNPYRYRGYYYDVEIGMYYLQSRYYDPTVSRFVNGDDVNTLNPSGSDINLFAYCRNNPVNESDFAGNAVLSLIFKFILGLFFGFLVQLFSDFVTYLYDKFIQNKEHSIITSPLGSYVGSCLTCGANMVVPISGKYWKMFVALGNIIPFVTKYLSILAANKFNFTKIRLLDFVIDVAALVLNIVISLFWGNKLKNKLNALKKKRVRGSKNTSLKMEKKTIKIHFNKLGLKSSFSITLSAAFLQTLFLILFP